MAVVSKQKLITSICRDSFYEFVKNFWSSIISEKPVWNWHIKYLCNEVQYCMERVFKGLPKEYDLVVNVPPGSSKSTIFSIMLPAWNWIRMPRCRHICSSHTEKLVLDLSRKCRSLVRSELYQACFPEIKAVEDQDTKGYWVNTMGGDRFSCTVGGSSPMGFHGHVLINDDLIDPQASLSQAELDNAENFVNDVLPSRKVSQEVSFSVFVGQRLHQRDPYAVALENKPVKHICIPVEDGYPIYPKELQAHYVNGLMDPIRFPSCVLEGKKKMPYSYAGQWGQNPIPLGGGMFKTDRIKIVHPSMVPNDFYRTVRFWDKAGSKGKGAYTVGIKIGHRNPGNAGEWWILDLVRDQWDSAEREKQIKLTARRDTQRVWIGLEQEPGSGGKESAEATVRNNPGYWTRVIIPSGDKVLRADPWSGQVNAGAVYMVEAPWNKEILDEYGYFPNSRYKDIVDASSGAFTVHTELEEEKKWNDYLKGDLIGHTEEEIKEMERNIGDKSVISVAGGDLTIDWEDD